MYLLVLNFKLKLVHTDPDPRRLFTGTSLTLIENQYLKKKIMFGVNCLNW